MSRISNKPMDNDKAALKAKQTTWLPFILILLSSTIFVIVFSFNSFNSMLANIKEVHKSRVAFLSNNINNRINSYESYIDIVGMAFDSGIRHLDESYIDNKIEYLVDIKEEIIGLTIYSESGVIVASKGFHPYDISNEILNTTKSTSHSVLGRSYFDQKKGLVMVMYKSLKINRETYIISLSIPVEDIFNIQKSTSTSDGINSITLWRENDYYFQYTDRGKDDQNIYNTPVDKRLVEESISHLENQSGKKIDILKSEGEPIVYLANNEERGSFTTSMFLSDYKLWLALKSNEQHFNQKFFQSLVRYISLYLFFIIILIFIFRSIKNRRHNYEIQTQYLVDHDYLTGIKSAYFFDRFLSKNIESRKEINIALLYVENLSTVNALHGHLIGDQVLIRISKVLVEYENMDLTVARVGGNEFAIYSSLASFEYIIGEILASFSEPIHCDGSYIEINIYSGLFLNDVKTKNLNDIKRNANLALDKARNEKLPLCRFETSILDDFIHKSTLTEELKLAVERQEVYVCYQPKVDQYGHIYSLEALLRWSNRKLGNIPPDVFIPIAESTGMIHELSRFVLEVVIKDRLKLSSIYSYCPNVAINISALQMFDKSYFSEIENIVRTHSLPKGALTLELTESIFISGVDRISQSMKKIRALGVLISLDDFGSGYSSLNMLASLPIDEVKLDRIFVNEVSDNKNKLLAIKNIIHLCNELSLDVVIEGIEDEGTEKILQSVGAKNFQGYYYCKPKKLKELTPIT